MRVVDATSMTELEREHERDRHNNESLRRLAEIRRLALTREQSTFYDEAVDCVYTNRSRCFLLSAGAGTGKT